MAVPKKDSNFKEDNYFKSEPILATMDDINQIKSIGYDFWQKEGVYSQQFYISVIRQNLSYVIKIKRYIIIAFCLVRYYEKTGYIGIDLLCVKKDYQRKGLGKNLLKFCIDNCKKLGYNKFYLHVATTNLPAINLYSKLGFEKIKTIKNYYFNDKPPDKDAYLMTLKFKDDKKEKNKEEIKSNEKKTAENNDKNEIINSKGNNYKKNYKEYKNISENNIYNNENSINKAFYKDNINNDIYKQITNKNFNKNYYHNIDNNIADNDNINNNIYKNAIINSQNKNYNFNNNIYYNYFGNNYNNNIYNNIHGNNNYNIGSYTQDYWNRVNHKFNG